jgi:ABC-type multidrug transport system ATPase subunit
MQVELCGVSRRYGKVRALDEVTLALAPGALTAVLGLNGAGKTTLLRCLAGVVAPDRGEVRCDGRPFRRDDLPLRRRCFFLPDFPLLFWDRTVAYNLSVILRLYEKDDAAAPARALDVLRELDLLPLATARVDTLSRGQIHKTALAALILVDPDLWLLDEPFASGMDPLALSFFKRAARDAAARGRTVLYSTQLLDVAERFADRIVVLHEGRVRAAAALDDLRATAQDPANPLEELFRKLREPTA